MIKTHEITTYTIDSHPYPEKVYDWIRNNWHDLGEFDVEDFADSFKALAERLGNARCDYSISLVPDRGEFLKLIGDISQEQIDALDADAMDLTGMGWDFTLIKALQATDPDDYQTFDGLNITIDISGALSELHKQGEWLYSDEALKEHCEAHEYQFLANGKFYT